MGWLFGKKKTPKVPLPGMSGLDDTLRFPSSPRADKVIEPESLKKAAGVREMPPPPPGISTDSFTESEDQQITPQEEIIEPREELISSSPGKNFIKVGVYRRILGEFNDLRDDLNDLSEANKKLEESEYNEENKFENLRRSVKSLHDRLLLVDKSLFNIQGD
jgi:hypothetical protein